MYDYVTAAAASTDPVNPLGPMSLGRKRGADGLGSGGLTKSGAS